jgi:DNA-binding MltR family transcriptional regulator
MKDLQELTINFEAFASRFSSETDRACAVLGAAFLDALLEDLCRKRLAALQDKLLHYPGPLSSLSARINLLYSLSWIDADTYSDLSVIRHIRNDFAHSFDHALDFCNQSIADRCCNLRSASAVLDGVKDCAKTNPNWSPSVFEQMRAALDTPRWRFQLAVEAIAQLLRDLPTSAPCGYTGPNLVNVCYGMSSSLRLDGHGEGLAPPLQGEQSA